MPIDIFCASGTILYVLRGTERIFKIMNTTKNNKKEHSMMESIRSYLKENEMFFALASAAALGNEQSAEYLAKLLRQ